jgi:hypothetical protein
LVYSLSYVTWWEQRYFNQGVVFNGKHARFGAV